MKLELYKLNKTFNNQRILEDVSFTVNSGEVFSLVGPNGAGKTTILRIILGLYTPDSGRVLYNDSVISDDIKYNIGFVLENFYLYKDMTAYENVEFFYRLYHDKIDKEKMKYEIERSLKLVNIFEDRNRDITFFSQGMKQRLCLARAIVNNPKLLILDEPLKGLDVDGKWEIRKIIKDLSNNGCTIYMNSHDMFEVEKLSDNIAIIKKGKILESGSIEYLRNKYKISDSESLEELYRKVIKG